MNVTSYKCPCCGAALTYAPTGTVTCASCGNAFDPENLSQMQEMLESAVSENAAEWTDTARDGAFEGMRAYSCPSCGGEIMAEETTAATFCPYCGNATIMGGQLSGAFKPDLIIPFKLDRAAATAALKAHMKGKPLLPKAFRDTHHLEEVRGLYVPFWLYSCDAAGSACYRGTRVRTWVSGRHQITETSHFMIERSGGLALTRIPADASKKMENSVMDAIEPFDYSAAIPFDPVYLSGFYADKYDVTADENADQINRRVRKSVEDQLRGTVGGYQSVRVEQSRVQTKNEQVQYALLPVWLLTTEYRGKQYLFAMNGQTGRMVGDLPVHHGRFFGWLFGVAAAAEVLLLLLLLLGGLL